MMASLTRRTPGLASFLSTQAITQRLTQCDSLSQLAPESIAMQAGKFDDDVDMPKEKRPRTAKKFADQ